MASTKALAVEVHSRHIGTAALMINGDSSWSIGPTPTQTVKVKFDGNTSIDDSTYGYSAVAVESNGKGGYRLFVRSDEDEDLIVEVAVDAAGNVDGASLAVLAQAQMYALEEQYKIDLNDSGGFGAGPVLLQGGSVNLYMNELGHYQIGTGSGAPVTLTVGGQPLDDQLLPPGWEVVEAVPASGGLQVFAQDPSGAIFDARFTAAGEYTGGNILAGAALDQLEQSLGVDIDGDNDLAAPAGWTSVIKSDLIRTAVDRALGPPTAAQPGMASALAAPLETAANSISHAELVGLLNGLIQSHRANNNAPITAQEVADMQALAARGKAAFAGNGAAAEYLAYSFARLVEGSDANRFFNGGQVQRSELGSLAANSSVDQLERLVAKWLLGGDMPSPATAGDSATGAPKAVTATYAKSAGTLFVDGITISDINQGTAGDCYLIAAVGGLAVTKPDALQAMFVENAPIDGVRTWGVRFFDANGAAHWVTVNDMLPVGQQGSSTLAFAASAGRELNGEIWLPLLEKAYAQANALSILPRAETTGQNSYAAIEGGLGDPLGNVIASKVIAYLDPGIGLGNNGYLVARPVDRNDPAAKAQMANEIKGLVNAGKTVWVGMLGETQSDAFGNQLLVKGHAHFLIDPNPADPNNDAMLVYNPWGLASLPNPPGPAGNNHISPATYTAVDLVGVPGTVFMVLDGPTG